MRIINRRSSAVVLLAALTFALFAASPAFAQEGDGEETPLPADAVTIHVAQAGETLESVAADYGIEVDALRVANSLSDWDELAVGQRVVIPEAPRAIGVVPPRQAFAGLDDTLYTLGYAYGVPVEQLAQLNRVANPVALYAGQAVRLPEAAPAPEGVTLRLGPNRTLLEAAVAANANPYALMLANDLPNLLFVPHGRVIVVPAGTAVAAPGMLRAPWQDVYLHPLPIDVGRIGGLTAVLDTPGTLTVTFLGRDWPVEQGEAGQFTSLLAVDRWTAPGLYPLTLSFTAADGQVSTHTRDVQITEGGYAAEYIKLTEDTAAVLGDPAVVAAEAGYIEQTMSGYTPERLWADGELWLLPSPGVLTSGFGTLRSYNGGGYNSYHAGADIAAPTGTPVYAPADGVVVDTGMLDVRGFVTIIDHGQGVYSGFWHQARILVEPGDEITRGQEIGAVGSTGLSTAAHLHWEMRVNGVQVDAMQWVREVMP